MVPWVAERVTESVRPPAGLRTGRGVNWESSHVVRWVSQLRTMSISSLKVAAVPASGPSRGGVAVHLA